ncbi:hypothetical protein GN956_G23543 [Arapaima gigas]
MRSMSGEPDTAGGGPCAPHPQPVDRDPNSGVFPKGDTLRAEKRWGQEEPRREKSSSTQPGTNVKDSSSQGGAPPHYVLQSTGRFSLPLSPPA